MKKSFRIAVASALALLLALGASPMSRAAAGEDRQPPSEISVSASGTVRLTPDKAAVSFGVTTQEETAELAQSRNSEAVNKVIAVLTGRGVEEKSIRTTGYSMYPRYDYTDDGDSYIIGYVVNTSMSIQDQQIDQVGKLLADCVAAGINKVDNVSFLCSGYDEAYSQALVQAVQNARAKAEVLAQAAGRELGEAVSITEGWQDTSARYDRGVKSAYGLAANDAVAPSFQPGESEITANVSVVFLMK